MARVHVRRSSLPPRTRVRSAGAGASAALLALTATGALLVAVPTTGAEPPADSPADPHAHHHDLAAQHNVTRSITSYEVPAIPLVRSDGKRVLLSTELNDGRPVVLDFIYTTCTSICPLSSQTFAQLQALLGPVRERVHLVSISIDPEEDRPAHLAEYARKFHAGPGWNHYTGTVQASVAAQRAFDVYRGDKMSHTPVTLVRVAPNMPWVRFDGFATADELLHELRTLVATN